MENRIFLISKGFGIDLLLLVSTLLLAPDVENVTEKEAEAGLKTDSSPQTQGASETDPEGSTLGRITNNHKRTVQKYVKCTSYGVL